jgi:hypothetical protein
MPEGIGKFIGPPVQPPHQFDNQTTQLAPSGETHWADTDMPRHVETKSGAVATFTWSVS